MPGADKRARPSKMKTVFTSDEIAHVWAQQNVSTGRCAANMHFSGPSFYSYGTEIARFIEHKGKRAVILNETGYSVSTSRHQGKVRQAIANSGTTVFWMGDIRRGNGLNFHGAKPGLPLYEYAVAMAKSFAEKASKARGAKGQHEAQQSHWLNRAMFISQFFGLRKKVDEKAIERLVASAAVAQRKLAKQQEQREKLARAEQQAAYEAWRDGTPMPEDAPSVFNARIFPVVFRIESDELVSTLGARVPLAEAKTALRFVQSRRERGWARNGETCPVGHYQLDAITGAGVKAGCHNITWAEIDRLAAILL